MKTAPATEHETEQSHLLLYPQGDPESLLGRAVQITRDGGWTMSDARAPGCEVTVRREKAAFHTSRKVDIHAMTSLAGSYAKFVSLQAKFGTANTADIDIANSEILRADMRGACGEYVVDTVFVGHGRRELVASADANAGLDVHVGVVGASPNVDTSQKIVDALAWDQDEGYGFSLRQNSKTEPLELNVSIPSIVTEGDDVRVRFTSTRIAYLVVYYIDGAGHADVLWPSNEEPAPRVAPDVPAVLPSAVERAQGFAIRAALTKPGEASRETLVVYGFADKADFDALKPEAGGASQDGVAYAAALTQKLEAVPMSRWSRAVVGYTIEPKAAPSASNGPGENR